MWTLLVIVREVAAQPPARLPRRPIFSEIDLFILHAPPETLDEDVVQCPPFAIHTDLDLRVQQQLGVLRTGEVAPLITPLKMPFQTGGTLVRAIVGYAAAATNPTAGGRTGSASTTRGWSWTSYPSPSNRLTSLRSTACRSSSS